MHCSLYIISKVFESNDYEDKRFKLIDLLTFEVKTDKDVSNIRDIILLTEIFVTCSFKYCEFAIRFVQIICHIAINENIGETVHASVLHLSSANVSHQTQSFIF